MVDNRPVIVYDSLSVRHNISASEETTYEIINL